MKKFLISAGVALCIAVMAVLILSLVECRDPDPGPIPDVTVTPIELEPPAPAPCAATAEPDAGNVLAWVQKAESGTVRSAPGGRKLLKLSGTSPLTLDDGSKTLTFDELEGVLFDQNGALAILDYDRSMGAVEVRLTDPEVGDGTATYVMEIVGNGLILAEFKNPTLRIRPVP